MFDPLPEPPLSTRARWQAFADATVNGDGHALHMMMPAHFREAIQATGGVPLAWHEIPAQGTE